ncbi:hypothetical protein PM082_019647 [Marasmius tenuissimus]|nr:hypothetical protein PM082_019647 [Marasmius tenuissimus]
MRTFIIALCVSFVSLAGALPQPVNVDSASLKRSTEQSSADQAFPYWDRKRTLSAEESNVDQAFPYWDRKKRTPSTEESDADAAFPYWDRK